MNQNNINTIDQEQQYIYIILSSTATRMGKMIQHVTKYRYNHVSLSLDPNNETIYSFARFHYCAPLVGGFVEESAYRYYYKNEDKIIVKVCKIPVSKDKYQEIIRHINEIKNDPERYIYNTISAISHTIGRTRPIYKTFTCVEFICHILQMSEFNQNVDFSMMASIKTLDACIDKYCIFEGDIIEVTNPTSWGNDEYTKSESGIKICTSTIRHFRKLIYRMVMC